MNVIRFSEPVELKTRTLFSNPPLIALLLTVAEPLRSSSRTLPSSNGVVPLVPFVPLMTLLASVNPATS